MKADAADRLDVVDIEAALRQTGFLCGALGELDAAELADWMADIARARARREAAVAKRADEEHAFWQRFAGWCSRLRQAADALESARHRATTDLIACQVMTLRVHDCSEATGRVGAAIGQHLADLARAAK